MAKLIAGGVNSSQIKGKLGSQVFARLNKETIIRAYQPKVSNPRTKAQIMIRKKFRGINHCISFAYNDTFKKYGIRLPNHNAYTSMNRMVFNNLVTKSIGYPHNYLPELPEKNQRLLGFNTDIKGEIFEYLAFRALTMTGQGGSKEVVIPGFSIPKSLGAGLSAGGPSDKYFGSNIAFSELDINVILMGVHNKTFDLTGSGLTEPVINPAEYDSGNIFSSTRDEVSTRFKYVYRNAIIVVEDPQNTDNWFVYFATGDEPSATAYGVSELSNLFVECAWPGVKQAERCGATMFLFSKSFEGQSLESVGVVDSDVSFNARECIVAVNDWTGKYTIQG